MPKKPSRKSGARPRRKSVPDLPAPAAPPAEHAEVKGGLTSKYIGETEKNLGRVLGSATPSDAMLLFDESDQLFE